MQSFLLYIGEFVLNILILIYVHIYNLFLFYALKSKNI